MDGPEGAAARLGLWLEHRLPVRLAMVRVRLDLDEAQLPAPAAVLGYDKLTLGVEEWPAVLVVGDQLRRLRLLEVDPITGAEHYAATYALRVFAMVRGDGELDVDLVRKRYVIAVREALLERKTLGELPPYDAAPVAGDGRFAVNPASITESYSDLAPTESGATIAGAWLAVEVTVQEALDPVNETTAPPAAMPGATPAPGPGMTEHTAGELDVAVAVDADTHRLPTHPAYL